MFRFIVILFLIFSQVNPAWAANDAESQSPEKLSKEIALKNLLEQFSYQDWRSWPTAYVASKGTPTLARYYISRVFKIDQSLADYLDVSAYLFHRLYLNTRNGQVFNLESEIKKITKRSNLKSNINDLAKDGIFTAYLEKLRYQFVLEYLEQNPSSKNNLLLLSSLDILEVDEKLYPHLKSNINRLSLKASPLYRKEFFDNQKLVQKIVKLCSAQPSTRKALANLFLIGVIDALENKNLSWAKYLFLQSKGTYPNFAVQYQVGKLLGEIDPQTLSLNQEVQKNSQDNNLFAVVEDDQDLKLNLSGQDAVDTKSSKTSVSYLFVFIILVLVIVLVLLVIMYKRYTEQLRLKFMMKQAQQDSEQEKSDSKSAASFDEFPLNDKVANF